MTATTRNKRKDNRNTALFPKEVEEADCKYYYQYNLLCLFLDKTHIHDEDPIK